MARQLTDDWQEVEEAFARLDKYQAWRPIVAAMRHLIAMIRADSRFHDLEPSVSHACLVFRRRAKRSVFVSWNVDNGSYRIAFVVGVFELRDSRIVREGAVLDVLFEYLERAPL